MPRLVLLRHGQAAWNLEDRFAGWWDVDLTLEGAAAASSAGSLLAAGQFEFDLCFASVQTRAIGTLNRALAAMGRLWLPIEKSWHLNERHYGKLTGLTKAEAAAEYGGDQLRNWIRNRDTRPPPVEANSQFDFTKDRRYEGFEIPFTESLLDTTARVLRYWEARIAPELKAGKRVLISAHGNSIGALIKHISRMSDAEIAAHGVRGGQPIIYELDDELQPVDHYYLTDRCSTHRRTE